jgi:hypothetical protein
VMACANDEVWWVRYRAGQTLMSLAEKDVDKLKSFVSQAPKSGEARDIEPTRTELAAAG